MGPARPKTVPSAGGVFSRALARRRVRWPWCLTTSHALPLLVWRQLRFRPRYVVAAFFAQGGVLYLYYIFFVWGFFFQLGRIPSDGHRHRVWQHGSHSAVFVWRPRRAARHGGKLYARDLPVTRRNDGGQWGQPSARGRFSPLRRRFPGCHRRLRFVKNKGGGGWHNGYLFDSTICLRLLSDCATGFTCGDCLATGPRCGWCDQLGCRADNEVCAACFVDMFIGVWVSGARELSALIESFEIYS